MLAISHSTNTWLVDSGCTNHMTPDSSSFQEPDQSYKAKVKIENGEFVEVKGKGVVAVKTPTGTNYISDVLFGPEICQSLLSVSQLLKKNYSLHFQNMTCTIVDHAGYELMAVKMRDKSFPIKWTETDLHAYTTVLDESVLWHKRFGHFSYAPLKHLQHKSLAQSLPVIHDEKSVSILPIRKAK